MVNENMLVVVFLRLELLVTHGAINFITIEFKYFGINRKVGSAKTPMHRVCEVILSPRRRRKASVT